MATSSNKAWLISSSSSSSSSVEDAADKPLATVEGHYYQFAGTVQNLIPLIAKCEGAEVLHDPGMHYMWQLHIAKKVAPEQNPSQSSPPPPQPDGAQQKGVRKRRSRQGSIGSLLDQKQTFKLDVGISTKGLDDHRSKKGHRDHQDRHEEQMMPVDADRWVVALGRLGCTDIKVRKLNKDGVEIPLDQSLAHSDTGINVWTLAFGRPHFRFDGTCENPVELENHHSDYQRREHLHTWELEFHPHKVPLSLIHSLTTHPRAA